MSNKYQEALDILCLDGIQFLDKAREFCHKYETSMKATLQELVDKGIPMKVVKWDCAKPETRCAKCGAGLERKHDYCWGCGQRIDWSDGND